MRDQSDHFTCAVATANGFAMPYRRATPPAQPEKERSLREKEVAQPPVSRQAKVEAPLRRAG
jgi:hypothetical protein